MQDPVHVLRLFHLDGFRNDSMESPAGLTPKYLASERISGELRSEYPACLFDGPAGLDVVPLSKLIEDAFSALSFQGNEAEQCEKVAHLLVKEIAKAAERKIEEDLSGLWGAAATSMIANPNLPESDREGIRKHLSRLRKEVTTNGSVIAFQDAAPLQLLHLVTYRLRDEQRRRMTDEVQALIVRLGELLENGGSDPINGAVRKQRLSSTQGILQDWQHQWDHNGTTDEVASVSAAATFLRDKAQVLLLLFRAIRIARLEANGEFDEEQHSLQFSNFGINDLTAEERALFPPITMHLDTRTFDANDFDEILSLLDLGVPVKVLVTIDRLDDGGERNVIASLSGWRVCLAERAAALGNTYVLQASASQAGLLMRSFKEGLLFDGPALFSVYTGTDQAELPAQTAASTILLTRAFPAFIYNPASGNDWATRLSLSENPQPEQRWPEVEVPAEMGAPGFKGNFTLVDYLAGVSRFSGEFQVMSNTLKDDTLVLLSDYLRASREEQGRLIPYVTLLDEKGKEHRAVCSRSMIRVLDRVETRWKGLQELIGINNVHAVRAAAAERERVAQEVELEKKRIDEQHRADIEQLTRSLAQKIVSNIAAGLLDLTPSGVDLDIPVSLPAPARTAPVPVPIEKPAEVTPAAEAPTRAPVEEDETLSLDEPYIDTPDCTSCDECLNRNDKIFAYNEDGKAYIKDARGGPFRDIVLAAESCPAHIIHPGKPLDPTEPGLEELMKRAEPYL